MRWSAFSRTQAMKASMTASSTSAGRQALGAGVVGQTGKADTLALGLELGHERLPGRGQLLPCRLDRLQPARGDRRKEVGADIGEALRADPGGDRVDGVQFFADFGQVERDPVGRFADQAAKAGDGRNQVPDSDRGEGVGGGHGVADVPKGGRCEALGTAG